MCFKGFSTFPSGDRSPGGSGSGDRAGLPLRARSSPAWRVLTRALRDLQARKAEPLSALHGSLEDSLLSSSFRCLRNQSNLKKKKKKAAELFKVQPFKASFITKLKTFKTDLAVTLISKSPIFLKVCFYIYCGNKTIL